MKLELTRVQLRDANRFVGEEHRHHGPSRGHVFSLGASVGMTLVGVAIVGRPVARGFDHLRVGEVVRLATDGTPNACSFLYGAARRAAKALGFAQLVTYTLESEPGTSLRAAGFREQAIVRARSWSCASRPREDKGPIVPKRLWVIDL